MHGNRGESHQLKLKLKVLNGNAISYIKIFIVFFKKCVYNVRIINTSLWLVPYVGHSSRENTFVSINMVSGINRCCKTVDRHFLGKLLEKNS